jgi:hypothetical protein
MITVDQLIEARKGLLKEREEEFDRNFEALREHVESELSKEGIILNGSLTLDYWDLHKYGGNSGVHKIRDRMYDYMHERGFTVQRGGKGAVYLKISGWVA